MNSTYTIVYDHLNFSQKHLVKNRNVHANVHANV